MNIGNSSGERPSGTVLFISKGEIILAESWTDVWNFRENMYSFFANSLLEPVSEENQEVLTKEFWRNFPLEGANPQLVLGLEKLIQYGAQLEQLDAEEARNTVNLEYTVLFLGPGNPKAPPWESFYRSKNKLFFGVTAFEMKQLLHENGIMSKKQGQQPEDHLGLQLLFISVLTNQLKELSGEEQISKVREQLSVIEKHLLSWVPDLCQDAKDHGEVGFYGALIELLWGMLLWDKELLEEFLAN